MLPQDSTLSDTARDLDPIVAVFDTKTMALRAVAELTAAEFHDIWLAVVSGETDAGETVVTSEGENGSTIILHRVLIERGSLEEHARSFDGVVPPGTAVLSLRVAAKFDQALKIIQLVGGHIEHY